MLAAELRPFGPSPIMDGSGDSAITEGSGDVLGELIRMSLVTGGSPGTARAEAAGENVGRVWTTGRGGWRQAEQLTFERLEHLPHLKVVDVHASLRPDVGSIVAVLGRRVAAAAGALVVGEVRAAELGFERFFLVAVRGRRG
jgi:hypothetical protein